MHGILSYHAGNKDSERNLRLRPNLILHIERKDPDIAKMWFVDDTFTKINIPPSFVMRSGDKVKGIVVKPEFGAYFIASMCPYHLKCDDGTIISFVPQRQQGITVSPGSDTFSEYLLQ